MTSTEHGSAEGSPSGPPTADDLRRVAFSHASMLHPGYTQDEVDEFVARAADQLAALTAENADLREQVHDLQQQLAAAAARPSPSDQAVGILATAQLTADQYVAEAEDFSRQMTSEARAQYEEQLSRAREKAGAIVQAAQEARATIAGGGAAATGAPDTRELEEQVAYLKAFGQACRVQLRSYLEALLTDVETEWGRAHPAVLPPAVLAGAPERAAAGLTFHGNAAADDQPAGADEPTRVAATRAPS